MFEVKVIIRLNTCEQGEDLSFKLQSLETRDALGAPFRVIIGRLLKDLKD